MSLARWRSSSRWANPAKDPSLPLDSVRIPLLTVDGSLLLVVAGIVEPKSFMRCFALVALSLLCCDCDLVEPSADPNPLT